MNGKILHFDANSREGVISGECGRRCCAPSSNATRQQPGAAGGGVDEMNREGTFQLTWCDSTFRGEALGTFGVEEPNPDIAGGIESQVSFA